ncbi:MAG: putative lipopolysaccharide heptosyltransferase III [Verrucomicrobiota bacterium]|nr:putative lipopolysaccharide heptosyltransferase III [Verrucomicrobiota bacterium]
MNILLIQLKRIGDLVLTTPAIAAVREKFPDAKLTVAVSRGCQQLLPAIAGIDRAVALGGLVREVPKWIGVAARPFEFCVDFTHNDRSAFVTFLSAAKQRISARHVELQSKIRAKSYNQLVDCKLRRLHTIDTHLALLEPLGIHNAPPQIRLALPEASLTQAADLLRLHGVTGEYLLVHPGSARAEKFWEPDRWAAVIDHAAAELQLPCVLTGAATAEEQGHVAAIKADARAPIIDLSGRTDLLVLAALVERARLLVTVDSAPMHFAAAFGTPEIALFGPTNPFHWRPRLHSAMILQGDSAVPVSEFVPKQPRAEMSLISTQAVIDAMESLLSASTAPRYE